MSLAASKLHTSSSWTSSGETSLSAASWPADSYEGHGIDITGLDTDWQQIGFYGSVMLDVSANAQITATKPLRSLTVACYDNDAGVHAVGIDTSGAVTLSSRLENGSIVFVNNARVGTIDRSGIWNEDPLWGFTVTFDGGVTNAQVEAVLHALSYSNGGPVEDWGYQIEHLEIAITLEGADDTYCHASSFVTVAPPSLTVLSPFANALAGQEGDDLFGATAFMFGANDVIDGKGGTDFLLLSSDYGTTFELDRLGGLKNVEIIQGTADQDFISIGQKQLADVQVISGGGEEDNTLGIVGTSVDLRGKAITDFWEIQLLTDGAVVTFDNKELALLAASAEAHTHVILKGDSFTDDELDFLYAQGIGTITDDSTEGDVVVLGSQRDSEISGSGNDVYYAAESALNPGDRIIDIFDVVFGSDTLQLTGDHGGTFRLNTISIEGIETLRGTAADDVIEVDAGQLEQFRVIDGGDHASVDTLRVYGTIIDLMDKTVCGFEAIEMKSAGATVFLTSKEAALTVSGIGGTSTRLVLTSAVLSDTERLALHRRGIDVVEDGSQRTIHRAPTIANLTDQVLLEGGETISLDTGSNALIACDDGLLGSLIVRVKDGAAPSHHIEVDTSGMIGLSNGLNAGSKVRVDGVEIGTVAETASGSSIHFTFNANAVPERVQELIQALTYRNADGISGHVVAIEFVLRDVGGRSSTTLVGVSSDVNEAPSDITLTGSSVRELCGWNTKVGDLQATDAPGTVLTYQILNADGSWGNTDGRFTIAADGTTLLVDGFKLDYEQARSHTIRVKATDLGGLTFEKSLTIGVADWTAEKTTGTAGNDLFKGGAGKDTLGGGYGNDMLYGGRGKDVFVFNTKPSKTTNLDRIMDYKVADDTIWLDNAVFRKLGSGSWSSPKSLNKQFFTIGTKARDKNDYLLYNKKTGTLSYDADGSGKSAAIAFAKLKAGLKMGAAEFKII